MGLEEQHSGVDGLIVGLAGHLEQRLCEGGQSGRAETNLRSCFRHVKGNWALWFCLKLGFAVVVVRRQAWCLAEGVVRVRAVGEVSEILST